MKKRFQCLFLIVFLFVSALPVNTVRAENTALPAAQTGGQIEPLVAIHASELTMALTTMPAAATTPRGSGTSGYEWWYVDFRYPVFNDALEEALRSEGIPYVLVSDADIAAGALLLPNGSPRYPILISTNNEAIADNEIAPLRSYVNAGGFLLAGSTSFTRNPDGTFRGDFALANEMGMHVVDNNMGYNWDQFMFFRRQVNHRLLTQFPSGWVPWLLAIADDWYNPGDNYLWKARASDATVLATEGDFPLLTVKNYGAGQIIYHTYFNHFIGIGGGSTDTFTYLIYRKAIEWAFESANVPLTRLSAWQYPYDAAIIVRHDLENTASQIQQIEASAAVEASVGMKGDYYFTTGTLRAGSPDNQLTEAQKLAAIQGLRRAVTQYGATIGSHNGGLRNTTGSYAPTAYQYWHWGPDEIILTSPAGYSSGREYVRTSFQMSFDDIEGWLAGTDNGRPGCGAAGNCPRTYVSPFYRGVYEDSRELMEELGVITTGEQNLGGLPSWVISYETDGKRFASLALPTSEWYIDGGQVEALELGWSSGHTTSTIHQAVDFYYDNGMLINFYGHYVATSGVFREYVIYGATKPRVWKTNAVGIYDWWVKRSPVQFIPTYTKNGASEVTSISVSGATDPETAVEVQIPGWNPSAPDVTIFLNGSPADSSQYRYTSTGVKIRVGSNINQVEVRRGTAPDGLTAVNDAYTTPEDTPLTVAAPGVLANDTGGNGSALSAAQGTAPTHGTLTLNADGSFTYTPAADYSGTDTFTYTASDGETQSAPATVTITITPVNDAPVISDIPDQTVAQGTAFAAINLDNYVADVDDPDAQIIWTYSGNSALNVSISPERVATISVPAATWSGAETITFRAADAGGLYAEDAAAFTVTSVNHDLTVTVEGSGTTDPSVGVHSYGYGTQVNVTASPAAGYRFDYWSGACVGTGECPVTLTGNQTVTAHFAQITYTLNYAAGENGTLSGDTPQTVPYGGSGSAVTAQPADGYFFVQWSDGLAANPRTDANVTSDVNVTASFEAVPPVTHTITASAGEGGSINPSGAVTVNEGSNQTFTIIPHTGYLITDVLVDGASIGASGSHTFEGVVTDHTIEASFTPAPPATWTITATAGTGGSIDPAGAISVTEGGSQSFSISAGEGYRILDVLVDGASIGAATGYTFDGVTSDHFIAASFELIPPATYTITASAGEGGSVSPSGAVTVTAGNDQGFTITANPGYRITDVLVDGSSVGARENYTFEGVAGDHTLSASFELIPPAIYTITATAGSNGGVDPSGAVSVTAGNSQSFNISANSGYRVASVLVDGASVGAVTSYTFENVAGDHTLAASFELIPPTTYTITASAGSNGSISPSGSVTVTAGSSQSFNISASAGYRIASVLVDGASVGAVSSYTFNNVTSGHTIAASFELIPPATYTITATAGTGGSISPSGAVTVTAGSNQSFTITANTGYSIANVLVDGASVGAVSSYTFPSVSAAHTIAASFSSTYATTDFVYAAGWQDPQTPRKLADVNGDGLVDLVGFSPTGVRVALGDGTNFAAATLWRAAFGTNSSAGGWNASTTVRTVGDVNGDGRADVIGFGSTGVQVSLSTGTSFAAPAYWIYAFGSSSSAGGWSVTQHNRMVADVNGDGRADIVGFGSFGTLVALSTGTGFAAPTYWAMGYGYSAAAGGWDGVQNPRIIADVNGDGCGDVVGFGNWGTIVSLSGACAASPQQIFVGWDYWTMEYGTQSGGWNATTTIRTAADVNGDGLADVVGFGDSGVLVSLTSGSSFAPSSYWKMGYGSVVGGWQVNRNPRLAVDVNGDDRADIAGFANDGLLVSRSTGTSFE